MISGLYILLILKCIGKCELEGLSLLMGNQGMLYMKIQ